LTHQAEKPTTPQQKVAPQTRQSTRTPTLVARFMLKRDIIHTMGVVVDIITPQAEVEMGEVGMVVMEGEVVGMVVAEMMEGRW